MQITNKVQQGQSFVDMVCQLTGDFSEVVKMSVSNDVSISENLVVGSEITYKNGNETTITPATAINQNENYGTNKLGIGYMQIGKTFRVE